MSLPAQLIDISNIPGFQEKKLFNIKFPQSFLQGVWVIWELEKAKTLSLQGEVSPQVKHALATCGTGDRN